MRDFKVRSDNRLSFRQRKSRPASLWLVPIIVTGGVLYGSLRSSQDATTHLAPIGVSNSVSVALSLPTSTQMDDSQQAAAATSIASLSTPTPILVADNTPSPKPTPVLDDTETIRPPSKEASTTPESVEKNWLEHKIKAGDSLAKIFKSFNLSPQLLYRIVNSNKSSKALNRIKPGEKLRIHLDDDGSFVELIYEIGPAKKLHIVNTTNGISAQFVERAFESKEKGIAGSIESSLFGSAQRAGLSDALTMKLAKIFQWDIDFALEIRSGDEFRVLFTEKWLDGQKLGNGPILAAEFINQGKIYRAVRYTDTNGTTGYFTPDGRQLRKDFLRTPVKFSRISSGFTKRRWHPVLKKWRSHKGVDYAAPTGTPVKSAGNGTLSFIGRKGGYGKVIYIQHPGRQTTVYGHLSRFKKGLKKGSRVKQGELIGYVGQTGLASGPHLHYEFRVNGHHHNPLKVTLPPAAPLNKRQMPAFKKAATPLLAQLDTLPNRTLVADARH